MARAPRAVGAPGRGRNGRRRRGSAARAGRDEGEGNGRQQPAGSVETCHVGSESGMRQALAGRGGRGARARDDALTTDEGQVSVSPADRPCRVGAPAEHDRPEQGPRAGRELERRVGGVERDQPQRAAVRPERRA